MGSCSTHVAQTGCFRILARRKYGRKFARGARGEPTRPTKLLKTKDPRIRRGWDSNPRAPYGTRRFRGAPVTTTSVPLPETVAAQLAKPKLVTSDSLCMDRARRLDLLLSHARLSLKN